MSTAKKGNVGFLSWVLMKGEFDKCNGLRYVVNNNEKELKKIINSYKK